MLPFLKAYIEHPKLEHLVKTGLYRLAADLAYGRIRDDLLDETQHRTHRILRVAPEDVAFLRDMGADAETLRKFQPYAGVKDGQRLLLWQLENRIGQDIAPCLRHMTAHKLMRYVDRQYPMLRGRKTDRGWPRYQEKQAVLTEYQDYLSMCSDRLGYDMKNSSVLFPKDLEKAHDRVQLKARIEDAAKLSEDFAAAMRSISWNLDFEMDDMMIVVPSSPEDIVAEGHALRTCVGTGGYIERVIKRECVILFLRRREDISRPFYTVQVDLRSRKAVQVRGMQNAGMTEDVRNFMGRFERQLLMVA